MVNIYIFFQTLRFFRKSARVSSFFRTFPNLQNLIKVFKNTSKLQFYTSILGLLVHNPIKHNIHTYKFVYFKSSKHSNLLQFHAHFYKKKIWALARLKSTAYVPHPLRIKAHVVPFQTIYIYTYIHEKIFNIYNMQNIYTMQFTASSPRWLDSLRRGMSYRRTCLSS